VRRGKLGAQAVVLALLCEMYFLYFVDRVSISAAAPVIKADLKVSNTQLGLAFSAFAIPYALFQLIGGWIGDRLGPRLMLIICCAIVGISTALMGAATGIVSLVLSRLALGFGEGAAFPTATRAMASWTPQSSWGFAQGIVHSFGADRQCGDAAARGWPARFFYLAQFICDARRSEFAGAHRLGLVFSQQSSRAPLDDFCGPGYAAGSSREPGANDSLAEAGQARDGP
jgi:MFS family permease